MKFFFTAVMPSLILAIPYFSKASGSVSFKELCSVDYPALTQAGSMKGTLSVCVLESDLGRDTSLYVISSFKREYALGVDRILKLSIAPVIEKRGKEIVLLYTAGVNTTCVATYSIESGIPEFSGIETIAWNDSGVYRKSESFEKYEDLLNKRGV